MERGPFGSVESWLSTPPNVHHTGRGFSFLFCLREGSDVGNTTEGLLEEKAESINSVALQCPRLLCCNLERQRMRWEVFFGDFRYEGLSSLSYGRWNTQSGKKKMKTNHSWLTPVC